MSNAKVCRLNFPLYCCECLGDENFVVAGGGGAAKTGIRNLIQILQVKKKNGKMVADPVAEFDTGKNAVMKMSIAIENQAEHQFKLAAAMGDHCNLYMVTTLKPDKQQKQQQHSKQNEGLKKRKKSESTNEKSAGSGDTGSANQERVDHHAFDLIHAFPLVTSAANDNNDDSKAAKISQTSVVLSRDGKLLAAGLSNGAIKVWDTRELCMMFEMAGHRNDVSDLDISPDSTLLVSVSRDSTACLWSLANGGKLSDLHTSWNRGLVSRTLRFRNCRFSMSPAPRGTQDRSPAAFTLFTTHEPAKRKLPSMRGGGMTSQQGGYVTKWVRDDKKGMRVQIVEPTGRDTVSSLAVSRDGHYLALGFMDSGSVEVYTAFRLHRVLRVAKAHSMFVTSISMMSDAPSLRHITGDCDARCLSVSADGYCHVALLKPPAMFTAWFLIIVLLFILAAVLFVLHTENKLL